MSRSSAVPPRARIAVAYDFDVITDAPQDRAAKPQPARSAAPPREETVDSGKARERP